MKNKILIIKTAATGDVVRTTTLLHPFSNDEVWWITSKMNIDILPQKLPCLKKIIAKEDVAVSIPQDVVFDLVLSLDDDKESIDLIDLIHYRKLIGAYRDKTNGSVTYTQESAHWFDLSLISKYPKEDADKKKFDGFMSVQEHLFKMIGKPFEGQEYLVYEGVKPNPKPKLVGIEERSGDRWPTKRWNQYRPFADRLKENGFEVLFFEQRSSLRDYMRDIANCSYVICGDTLCMHLALAFKIPTLTIFTCTSPNEIYSYNRMEKIVSPLLWEAFFKTTYVSKAVESITQKMVCDGFTKLLPST